MGLIFAYHKVIGRIIPVSICRVFRLGKHFGRPRQADHLKPGVRDQPGQRGKTPSLLKNTKTSQEGAIVPITQEAEVGESIEPGRQRLQ